jgi:hypothetical protein
LDELLELYDIAMERQSRIAKTLAAAMGADVSDDAQSRTMHGNTDSNTYNLNTANDLGFLPINLGYETMN